MATRTYIKNVSTATTGVSIQIARKGRIKVMSGSVNNAAAGDLEVSFASLSQLSLATPDQSVIGRSQAGVTPFAFFKLECDVPVEAFQYIYFHESGAGNSAVCNIVVQES